MLVTPSVIAPQRGHKIYRDNIQGYVCATLLNQDVYLYDKPLTFPPQPFAENALPFEYPDVECTWVNGSRAVEGVPSKIINMGRSSHTLFENPTRDQILQILASQPIMDVFPSFRSVNIDILKAVIFFWRLASAIIRTNAYPAFRDKEHFDEVMKQSKRLEEDGIMVIGSRKRRRTATDPKSLEVGSALTEEDVNNLKSLSDYVSELEEDLVKVHKAKPSVNPKMWLESSEVCQNRGILLPFVSDLAYPSVEGAPQFVIDRFSHNLHEDDVQSGILLAKYCRDLVKGAGVPLIQAVEHIFKCIDIGLKAQARVVPIFDKAKYLGCILEGYGFRLQMGDEVFIPVEPEQLTKHMRLMDLNAYVRDELDAMWQDGELKDLSMREISEKLEGHPRIKDRAVRQGFFDILKKMPQAPYMKINDENVIRLLRKIENEEDWPPEYPMHVDALFGDKTTKLMAVFGYQAPTFNVTGGKKIKLERHDPIVSLSYEVVDIKKAVEAIEYLKKERAILNDPGRMSTPHRGHTVHRLAKDEMLLAIRRIALGDMPQLTPASRKSGGKTINEIVDTDW